MADTQSSGDFAASRSFPALREPVYRKYFICTAFGMMGDSIEHVISYWIIFAKFQSPTLGGVAILTHWLPFLFFSVQSGAFADRFDRRRVIQLSQLMFALVSIGWATLFLTDSLEQWHAVVLLTIHGFAGVLWGPASQAIVHEMVRPALLPSAVRLMSTGRQLGLLMAPAVGGLLLFALGPAIGLFVNVLFYLPTIIWLWRIPQGAGPRPAAATRRGGGFRDILVTLREVAGNRVIISMILMAGAASFFVGNAYQAQMPEYAADLGATKDGHGHGAPMLYSVLLVAEAAGALFAGLILEWRGLLRPDPRSAMVLVLFWCLALIGFAGSGFYPVSVFLLFVSGFLGLAFYSMAQTLVQLHAPEHARGRVIGLFSMSALGLRAFSGLTVGVLGSMIGIHWSLAASALAVLAIVAVLISIRGKRA